MARLDLDSARYWVARNRRMVHRGEYDVELRPGDQIEIYTIMSGGCRG
jgi:sulfur carrier protein ThiS